MEKFFRFAVRRPFLSKALVTLFPGLPLAVALIWMDVPLADCWICIALVLFVLFSLINLSVIILLNPRVKALNRDCDPLPLLEITGFLLTCPLPASTRITLSLNHAVALRDMGDYDKALDVIAHIDLSKPRKIPPMVKFVYFHNYADLLDQLGRSEDADTCFARATEMYDAIPAKRRTAPLENAVRLARATACCRRQDYAQAVELLQDTEGNDLRQRVARGMILARCAAALGQPRRAEEWLHYVIAHGNRLDLVRQAGEMLKNLENP